jgi:hypothetical protein
MATITKMQPRPNTYRMDNILVDEYAEKIGAIGLAIYNVLARYADRQTGVCFPCIGTIAKKLKLGRTTVKKYLRILREHGLLAIFARTTTEGDPTSNSYLLLDPSPEKVARRRRQFDEMLTPQQGELSCAGGRSAADPPPCPSATDPRSAGVPEQSSSLNKRERTSETMAPQPTRRQQTCPHPASEIVTLPDNITICNHCYLLLGQNGTGIAEETNPTEGVCAA